MPFILNENLTAADSNAACCHAGWLQIDAEETDLDVQLDLAETKGKAICTMYTESIDVDDSAPTKEDVLKMVEKHIEYLTKDLARFESWLNIAKS